jgi:hypothetical protein
VPSAEAVLEPDPDEAIMYEDFLIAGLRMPPRPALASHNYQNIFGSLVASGVYLWGMNL